MGNISLFALLLLTLSGFARSKPWNIWGGGGEEGPVPEEGECSHWKADNRFYSNFDGDDLTGFHRTLPIGTYATVYNELTNKTVSVRIVGRGPIADGRVMHLSPAAFDQVSRLAEVVFDCKIFTGEGSQGFEHGSSYGLGNQGQGSNYGNGNQGGSYGSGIGNQGGSYGKQGIGYSNNGSSYGLGNQGGYGSGIRPGNGYGVGNQGGSYGSGMGSGSNYGGQQGQQGYNGNSYGNGGLNQGTGYNSGNQQQRPSYGTGNVGSNYNSGGYPVSRPVSGTLNPSFEAPPVLVQNQDPYSSTSSRYNRDAPKPCPCNKSESKAEE